MQDRWDLRGRQGRSPCKLLFGTGPGRGIHFLERSSGPGVGTGNFKRGPCNLCFKRRLACFRGCLCCVLWEKQAVRCLLVFLIVNWLNHNSCRHPAGSFLMYSIYIWFHRGHLRDIQCRSCLGILSYLMFACGSCPSFYILDPPTQNWFGYVLVCWSNTFLSTEPLCHRSISFFAVILPSPASRPTSVRRKLLIVHTTGTIPMHLRLNRFHWV